MSQAVFTLIGVVVGALATLLSEVLLERRREDRRMRTARRMLSLELEEAKEFLAQSAQQGAWIGRPLDVLSNEQWAEHRSVYGAVKDDDRWNPVADAFLAVAEVRRHYADCEQGDECDGSGLNIVTSIDKAIRILRPTL